MARDIIYDLGWARASLYPLAAGSATRENRFGTADENNAIFTNQEANGLRLIERPEFIRKRPSGFRHGIGRHLGTEHTIEIERLWVQKFDSPEVTLSLNTAYCLGIVWLEAPPVDPPAAIGRMYYGVYFTQAVLRPGEGNVFVGEDALSAAYYETLYANELV